MGGAVLEGVPATHAAQVGNEDGPFEASICRGDQTAVAEGLAQLAPNAYRLARHLGLSSADAEDAVQTAFLQVLSHLPSYQKGASARAWVMSHVIHTSRNCLRSETRRKAREAQALRGQDVSPASGAERAELLERVQQAVQDLPEHYRLPLWLHYVEGLSPREVASALTITDSTVRNQLARGLDQLRGHCASLGIGAAAIPGAIAMLPLESPPPTLIAAMAGLLKTSAANASVGAAAAAGKVAAPHSMLGGGGLKIAACVLLATAATTAAVALVPKGDPVEPAKPAPKVDAPVSEEKPAPKNGGDRTLLGSPDYELTPEHPGSWRGDGTGRYPGATPPADFGRTQKGDSGEYTTKNIRWMTRMPSFSLGNPLIVGDRIFAGAEMTGVVCLSKADGKILWIRHNTYFEAATAEEKSAAPELVHEAEALAAQTTKLCDELIREFNAGISPNGMPADRLKALDAKCQEYLQVERKYVDVGVKIKKYPSLPSKQHCGWTTTTPCSDGKHIWVLHGTGVFSCFDLNGNRVWSQSILCGWEHGNHQSPVLVGDKLILMLKLYPSEGFVYAFDKTTGKPLWKSKSDPYQAGSLVTAKIQGVDVVLDSDGQCYRAADGQPLFKAGSYKASWPTPIVDNGVVYHVFNAMHIGRYGQTDLVGVRLPAQAAEGAACTKLFTTQLWEDDSRGQNKLFISSVLAHEGLLYAFSEGGILVVADTATGKVLYKKTLDANPLGSGVSFPGCCASITLAGKYIYLLSDQGIVYVLEPGREFKLVARNVLQNIATRPAPELVMKGKQEQTQSTPIFEGSCMYLRGAEYLYCIGGAK